jgi:hypothetical protein
MQFVAGIFWRTLALIPNLQPLIKYGENYWHLYVCVCVYVLPKDLPCEHSFGGYYGWTLSEK